MFFTKPSNDIKYNKIKEIEKVLSLPNVIVRGEPTMTRKQVSALRWILANKIYDMLVEDVVDENNESEYPITTAQFYKKINKLCKNQIYLFSTEWRINWLIGMWKYYDYLNS